MTRHTMQRDCSGAMNSFYDRTDTPVADDARWQDGFAYNPSALAPHVTARTAFRLRELYFAKKGVKVNRDEGKEKGVKETQERTWPRIPRPPSSPRPTPLPSPHHPPQERAILRVLGEDQSVGNARVPSGGRGAGGVNNIWLAAIYDEVPFLPRTRRPPHASAPPHF